MRYTTPKRCMRNQNLVSQLKFLDPVYRHEHHKSKPRSRRPWFNVSWIISTQVLKEKLGELIGEEFSGLFDNLTRHERG